jgi:hypothetical protein
VIRTATAADLPAVVALWDVAGGPTRTPHSLVNAERLFEPDPEALLVAAAMARAESLGASRVDAMVNDANDGARAFWASAGFSLEDHDSRWSRLVPPGG